ncbi:Centrin-1 [Mortierella sp. 14UC]|nr:Centrin-1 [Mortierella sp. 14UC]
MSKARAPTSRKAAEGHAGMSEKYYQELVDTFQLYSAKETDTLSLKGLQKAMRTVGFGATLDDIIEIVKDTPSLSIHSAKTNKRQASRKSKGKGTTSQRLGADNSSSRTISSRTGHKSKYVDSDGGDSGGDDNDEGDDGKEYLDEDDLSFTLEDFVTLMSPSEDEHAQDEISRVFQLFDTEGKGCIRLEDLRRVATELAIPIKEQELQEMIEEADRDGDGGVTEQEFARVMKKAGFLE